MFERGARSGGIAGSTEPAGTTVTRRSRSVSCARGVTCPPLASSTVAPISICRASISVMMSNRRIICIFLRPLLLQHRDERQVSVLLGVVEAVSDDKVILDREADVVDLYLHLPPRRLAQETRRLQ